MSLHTDHFLRTLDTLGYALIAISNEDEGTIAYDLYRNAAIKSFELSLETAGKLLRKSLKLFGGSPRSVDALVYNDILRHAGKHGLLNEAEVVRWLGYRANRNTTAHDYGAGFANETLMILPKYVEDARALAARIAGVQAGE